METRELGKHAYAGACDPANRFTNSRMQTFSVGVFEWVPRANGSGAKRSPVKVRVRGNREDAAAVYAKAAEVAKALDDGTYNGPKLVTLKGPWKH